MNIICVVGARPNFMKVAPVQRALVAAGHDATLVHTGQHYDAAMSQVFFQELRMPEPHINLQVGSASHALQTARVMERFEPVLLARPPQMVLVAGDVNSTLGCALVAVKLGVPVAHLEAGVRSNDRRMPEELNRLCVDHMSDILLTPSADADRNLRREGLPQTRIFCVGNAMIDSVHAHLPAARLRVAALCARYGIAPGAYALATLHRPSNVDVPDTLARLLTALRQVAQAVPVLFVAHPRTQARLKEQTHMHGVQCIDPLGYLDFLGLQSAAQMILTDSGGMQEESTALGVPCLTLRDNTEWPMTLQAGTNTLVGNHVARIVAASADILRGHGKVGTVPPLWDGKTGERVAAVLERFNLSRGSSAPPAQR